MSGYQDENPYASPEGAAEAAVPEIHGIWRDRDELPVLPRGMKAPKACWVTNQERSCRKWQISCVAKTIAGLYLLCFVPIIGFPLAVVVTLALISHGHHNFSDDYRARRLALR